MPKEEKEKDKQSLSLQDKKHFKAVTEEVAPAPVVTEPVEHHKHTQDNPVEPEKKSFIVPETDNISPLQTAKEDKGIFVKFFLVTFLGTLLALALAGGVYVYLTGTKKDVPEVTPMPSLQPSETAMPEASPSSSPSTKVNLMSYKLSVLNGNGGIGTAGAAKAIIEKGGFKVAYIGNADNFNFTDTIIQAKSSVPTAVVETLKLNLAEKYAVKVGDALDTASNYDIVVNVGSK